MKFTTAKLINKNNVIETIFEMKEDWDATYNISGVVKNVISWSFDGDEPLDYELFANIYVKWDGCSHFWFEGMDNLYSEEDRGKDSYYHICGVRDYIGFMRNLVFCYEIMIENLGEDKILEKDELYELRQLNLLDGYRILYE